MGETGSTVKAYVVGVGLTVASARRYERGQSEVVVSALLAGLLALTAGCQGDSDNGESEAPSRPPACGLLSKDTVQSVTGATKVTALGTMTPAEERRLGGQKCQVVDAATFAPLLLISVSDADSKEDVRRQASLVKKESRSMPGCAPRTFLPDGGYVCARSDATVAAVATTDRLIRVWAYGDAADSLTADNATALFAEIDRHVEAYDKSQGG